MANGLLRKEFWSQPELARQLGKTTNTILSWKAKGFTPPETILGGPGPHRKSTVLEWLRSTERPARKVEG